MLTGACRVFLALGAVLALLACHVLFPFDLQAPDRPEVDLRSPDRPGVDLRSPDRARLDLRALDACGPGRTNCGGSCVDLTSDPENCKVCGNKCPAPVSGPSTGAARCAASTCDVSCTTGYTRCPTANGFACVILASDPRFCGSCTNPCGAASRCVASACVKDDCALGLIQCPYSYPSCVNKLTDPENCGGCNNHCGVHSGNDRCNAGTCSSTCASASITCSSGSWPWQRIVCTDTRTDPSFCGGCTTKCQAGQLCASGTCKSFLHAASAWQCGGSYPIFCTVLGATVCLPSGPCP